MENNQETNSVAHGSAVLIEQAVISELKAPWQELEVNGVAKILNTDIALELRGEHLWLWVIRVLEES